MGSRLELQTFLEGILESKAVYFQPPSTIEMEYPCIVYQRSYLRSTFADNLLYSLNVQYTVTVIDFNPDSLIPGKIILLPKCSFDRHMVVDNLYHDVFTLFF